MKIEIGSNFWELALDSKRIKNFWWESDEYYKTYLKSGRNAFKAICKYLAIKNKRVIFPAYLCETETEPWYEEKWSVGYYPVEDDFSLDYKKLDSCILDFNPDIIIIQNYFGFETIDDECKKVLKRYQCQGAVIIEDITQSLLTDKKYEEADYYVASFRKFFAIPDGGVLISREKIDTLEIELSDPNIEVNAFQAYRLKQKYFNTGIPEIKKLFRDKYMKLNEQISINDKLYNMSDASKDILRSINIEFISSVRVRNYNYLYERLQEMDYIRTPLKLKDTDHIPLFFPVFIDNNEMRIKLRRYLASKDIYCPIIWQRPVNLKHKVQAVENIYNCILCFPIDQRYDLEDMDRIVTTLKEWNIGK